MNLAAIIGEPRKGEKVTIAAGSNAELHTLPIRRSGSRRSLRTLILIALAFALIYWAVGLVIRSGDRLVVWDDLRSTFMDAGEFLDNPYDEAGYFAMPWANLFLLPFDPLPLELAALIMIALYFTLLAAAVNKFGGGKLSLIAALSSAIAFDAALEINIDWLVVIGLLIPREWSAPFLLIKPQTALGYPLAFKRREFVRAVIVGLLTLIAALLIWGVFPLDLLENIRRWETNPLVNIAPMSIIGVPLSILIGIGLAYFAFRRRDPVYSVAAGLFFVPYAAPVSALVMFTLLCARHPRACLFVSGLIWLVVIPLAFRFIGG